MNNEIAVISVICTLILHVFHLCLGVFLWHFVLEHWNIHKFGGTPRTSGRQIARFRSTGKWRRIYGCNEFTILGPVCALCHATTV